MQTTAHIRFVTRNGKRVAQYSFTGNVWFRMAVADAEKALKTGTAHIGFMSNVKCVAA